MIGAVLVFALLAACHRGPDPEPPAPPERPAVAAHGLDPRAARDAILFGDLDRARVAFRALAEGVVSVPGDEASRAAALNASGRGAAAEEGPDAARALGDLGVACGACHVSEGTRLTPVESPSAQGDGVRPEMARHDRALAIAWSGLVRADPGELAAAAAALRSSNLSTLGGPTPEAAVAMDDAVTAAGEALAMAAPAERGARFGELLSTCALCHAVSPGGLQPEPD